MRLKFPDSRIALLISAFAITFNSSCFAADISVRTFGAIPNDDKDDTEAIIKAVEACQNGDRLIFEKGQYDIYKTISLRGKKNLEIAGNGAMLMMRGYDRETDRGAFTLFTIQSCKNLTIHNIFIDQFPLRHMEGKVVALGQDYFDLEISREFLPITGSEKIGTMMNYNSDGTPNGREFYNPKVKARELIKPNVLRISMDDNKLKFLKIGEYVLIRHTGYGPNSISIDECAGIILRDVDMYSGGMGLYAGNRSSDITFERFNITYRPGTERLMSVNADGIHLNKCGGKIIIKDCVMKGMGDDCINIHSMFARVTGIDIDSSRIILEGGKSRSKAGGDMRVMYPGYAIPGDILVFYDVGTMQKKGTAVVKSYTMKDKLAEVVLDKVPAELKAEDLIDNLAYLPSSVSVTGSKFGRNRARGFLCQISNVLMENNEWDHTSSGAIWIICDTHFWFESGPVNNVTIRNNRIIGCNKGETFREGAIVIFCEQKGWQQYGPAGIHKNITIENNTIEDTDASGIFICSAENVNVLGNKFRNCSQNPGKITSGNFAIYYRDTDKGIVSGNKFSNCKDPFGQEGSKDIEQKFLQAK